MWSLGSRHGDKVEFLATHIEMAMMRKLLALLAVVGSLAMADEPAIVTPGRNQPPVLPSAPKQPGTPMYPRSACIGPVVNGVCEGTIQSTDPTPKRCNGAVLNGRCIGAEL